MWLHGEMYDKDQVKANCDILLQDITYDATEDNLLDMTEKDFNSLYKRLGYKIELDFSYQGKLNELTRLWNYKPGPQMIKTFGLGISKKLYQRVLK